MLKLENDDTCTWKITKALVGARYGFNIVTKVGTKIRKKWILQCESKKLLFGSILWLQHLQPKLEKKWILKCESKKRFLGAVYGFNILTHEYIIFNYNQMWMWWCDSYDLRMYFKHRFFNVLAVVFGHNVKLKSSISFNPLHSDDQNI